MLLLPGQSVCDLHRSPRSGADDAALSALRGVQVLSLLQQLSRETLFSLPPHRRVKNDVPFSKKSLCAAFPGTRFDVFSISRRRTGLQPVDHFAGSQRYALHRRIERGLNRNRRLVKSAHFSYELECRRVYFIVCRRRVEVEEGSDISAHLPTSLYYIV